MICRNFLIMAQESLNVVLRDHVQPDRRFVEEQHFGRVEQGGDQLHFHPLAQRQLAHRLAEQLRTPSRSTSSSRVRSKRSGSIM